MARTTTRKKKTADQPDSPYGPPSPPGPATLPGQCTTPLCGAEADLQDESHPRWTGWIRAGVHGSTEPDRLWCSGQCAAYGIALAELRMAEIREAADVR